MPKNNASLYSYKFQHKLKVASIVLNYIVLSVGILVLLGWQFNLVFLRRPIGHLVSMHPLTATCFCLSALALIMLVKRKSLLLVRLLATIVLIAATMEVLEYIGVLSKGADHLLFYAKTSRDLVNGHPNVMAPITALNFLFAASAILLLTGKATVLAAQYLVLAVLCFSLFSVVGYVYGLSPFYSFFSYYPMAVHTAICFLLFGFAGLFAKCRKGFMAEFISPYGGTRLAIQLLPMAILVPTVVGLLSLYGAEQGLYNRLFGVALTTSLSIYIFAVFIWKSMASINRLSFSLSEEKARQQSSQLGGLIMNAALDAIVCFDAAGKITLWNPSAEKMFGWKKEEVLGKPMSETIIPPHLREKHAAGMKAYLTEGRPGILGRVMVTKAVDRHNRLLDIELAVTRLRWDDSEIFCGFIRDITERMQHLHNIEAQNAKLKDIAWTQSHVVRAPVANILGLMDLLSDPRIDKAAADEILSHMKNSVQQLDGIIREIVRKSEEI